MSSIDRYITDIDRTLLLIKNTKNIGQDVRRNIDEMATQVKKKLEKARQAVKKEVVQIIDGKFSLEENGGQEAEKAERAYENLMKEMKNIISNASRIIIREVEEVENVIYLKPDENLMDKVEEYKKQLEVLQNEMKELQKRLNEEKEKYKQEKEKHKQEEEKLKEKHKHEQLKTMKEHEQAREELKKQHQQELKKTTQPEEIEKLKQSHKQEIEKLKHSMKPFEEDDKKTLPPSIEENSVENSEDYENITNEMLKLKEILSERTIHFTESFNTRTRNIIDFLHKSWNAVQLIHKTIDDQKTLIDELYYNNRIESKLNNYELNELDECKKENMRMNNHIIELNDYKIKLESESNQLKTRISQLNKDIALINQTITFLEEEKISVKLENVQNVQNVQNSENSKIKKMLILIINLLKLYSKNLEKMEQINEILGKNTLGLNKFLTKIENTKIQVVEQNEKLLRIIKVFNASNVKNAEKLHEIEERNNKIESTFIDIRNDQKKIELENNDLKTENNNLRTENVRLINVITKIEYDAKSNIDAFVVKMTEQLKQIQEDFNKQQKELINCKDEKKTLMKSVKLLENGINELKKEIEENEKKYKNEEKKYKNLKNDFDQIEIGFPLAMGKMELIKSQNEELIKRNKNLIEKLNMCIKRYEKLKTQSENQQIRPVEEKIGQNASRLSDDEPPQPPLLFIRDSKDVAKLEHLEKKLKECHDELEKQKNELEKIRSNFKDCTEENKKLTEDYTKSQEKIKQLELELKEKQKQYDKTFDLLQNFTSLLNAVHQNTEIKSGGSINKPSFWEQMEQVQKEINEKKTPQNKQQELKFQQPTTEVKMSLIQETQTENLEKFLNDINKQFENKKRLENMSTNDVIDMKIISEIENSKFSWIEQHLPDKKINPGTFEGNETDKNGDGNPKAKLNYLIKEFKNESSFNANVIEMYKSKIIYGYLNDCDNLYANIEKFYNITNRKNSVQPITALIGSVFGYSNNKTINDENKNNLKKLTDIIVELYDELVNQIQKNGDAKKGGVPPQDDILKSPTTSSALSTLVAVTSIGGQFSITVAIVAMLVITIIFLIYLIYILKSEKIHKYIIKYYQEDGQGEVISSGQC